MNTKLNNEELKNVDGGNGITAGIEAGLAGAKTGLESGLENDLPEVAKLKEELLEKLSGGNALNDAVAKCGDDSVEIGNYMKEHAEKSVNLDKIAGGQEGEVQVNCNGCPHKKTEQVTDKHKA
jgi:hypothetical protein